MILYGSNLSPFVRRVSILLALQGRDYETRSLAVSGEDFEKLKRVNPLGRVPALARDDGSVLIETFAIADWLEEAAPAAVRTIPASGEARVQAMQVIANANSTAEKAVNYFYEKNRRPEEFHWAEQLARVAGQVRAGLAVLEARTPEAGFFGGAAPGSAHPGAADAAVVCAYDFIAATNPDLFDRPYPRLAALAARANATPAFADCHPSKA